MQVLNIFMEKKIDTEVRSSFSLEKIREMLKADKFSDIAEIRLGNDLPLTLSLEMVTGDGKLSFLDRKSVV